MDGDSLLPYLSGEQAKWKDEVFCEHLAHGSEGPRAMIRQGHWKLSYTQLDEPEFELYDLARDPGEFTNLAGQSETMAIQNRLFARIRDFWPEPRRASPHHQGEPGRAVSAQGTDRRWRKPALLIQPNNPTDQHPPAGRALALCERATARTPDQFLTCLRRGLS